MNEWIRPIEIAQRALQTIATRLEHEPFVPAAAFAENDGQSELERHVEARHPATETYPAEIVKGVAATREQLQDAPETPFWPRNLDGGPWP